MEAFSLLKYWRGNGSNSFANGRTTTTTNATDFLSSSSSSTTTIVTTVSPRFSDDDDDDDGPFFDFEFTLPDETETNPDEKPMKENKNQTLFETIDIINDNDDGESEDSESSSDDDDEEEEVSEHDVSLSPPVTSPADENLFFKGQLAQIEPSSLLEANPKFPNSLSKSAARFRVLMLKFKKSKENNPGNDLKKDEKGQSRKFFAVKLMKDNKKEQKSDEKDEDEEDESKFSKDVMQKYLKMVKPLHKIRVSKLKFSGQLTSLSSGAAEVKDGEVAEVAEVKNSTVKSLKQGNVSAAGMGLRVVCKRLGKSKSASVATVAVGAAAAAAQSASRRRDDSLLQQQDGIQSAILHCKRSFNASRDSESSILSRSTSDPSNEKSMDPSTEDPCSDEGKKG